MRIYAVADIHGRPDRIARIRDNIIRHEPDVLIIAGDITNYRQAENIIARLNAMPVPVGAIRGNSDLRRVDRLLEIYPNISPLHLQLSQIGDARIVGVSGALPLPLRTRIAWREKQLMDALASLVSTQSILVAHPPPWGVRDEAFGRWHTGCRSLHKLVVRQQPAMLICGHVHERPGTAAIGQTLIVNCSMARASQGAIVAFVRDRPPQVELLV
ncbi:MAG: metallophosphoesterase [Desulfobacterales bacterium]|nr:MAG: metallophosphoesterase [Desulfobacterales bacterium]